MINPAYTGLERKGRWWWWTERLIYENLASLYLSARSWHYSLQYTLRPRDFTLQVLGRTCDVIAQQTSQAAPISLHTVEFGVIAARPKILTVLPIMPAALQIQGWYRMVSGADWGSLIKPFVRYDHYISPEKQIPMLCNLDLKRRCRPRCMLDN